MQYKRLFIQNVLIFLTIVTNNRIPILIDNTVATRLVEKGIDLLVVMDILGHTNIETTMRYAHPTPKRKSDAIAVLNSYN